MKCADEYRSQFYRFGLQVNILSSSPGFHVDVSVTPDQEARGGKSSTGKVDKIYRTVTLEPSHQTQVEVTSPMEPAFGYTWHSPNGIRLVQGAGALPGSRPVDVF